MPAAAPTQVMQGIEVPASSVNPEAFFHLTRRLTITQKTFTYAGLGFTDNVPMLQTGILSEIVVKATGTLTATPGTGSIATTSRWPYDLIKAARFSANGQSNLINVSGSYLKARELMARGDLTDRGVTKAIGGAHPGNAVSQGTLSLNVEAWGVGQNTTGIAGGNYGVDLEWSIPVAYDNLNLMGAIFAQTSSTDLNLALDWAPVSDLFTLAGNATVALSLSVVVQAVLYTIPVAPNGSDIIVPDLSVFHSLIQTRFNGPSNGLNEVRLSGQGVGRQLLRLFWKLYSNGGPLPINATNYGTVGWRYGGNDTPEVYPDGKTLAYRQERTFGTDLSTYAGIGVLDFCNENAFRDSIDEGTATELRLLLEVPSGLALTSPYIEYVQETVSAGAAV